MCKSLWEFFCATHWQRLWQGMNVIVPFPPLALAAPGSHPEGVVERIRRECADKNPEDTSWAGLKRKFGAEDG